MKREITRFNKYEIRDMLADGRIESLKQKNPTTLTPRERGIVIFLDTAVALDKVTPGGFSNISEVRVMQEDAGGTPVISYEYQLIMSESMLKRQEAQRNGATKQQPKTAPRTVSNKQKRDAFLRSPEGKQAAYVEALRQKKTQDSRKK